MKKFLLVLILLFGINNVATATLIELDWMQEHDGLVTFDDRTELEWLDLTQTMDKTYSEVELLLAGGGDWTGWRYATSSEVDSLRQSSPYVHSSTENNIQASDYDEMLSFIDLIGQTYAFGDTYSSILGNKGMYEQEEPGAYEAWQLVGTIALVTEDPGTSAEMYARGWNHENMYISRNSNVGSWLVRSAAPVPEPATMLLFGLGLLGLSGVNRRKQ